MKTMNALDSRSATCYAVTSTAGGSTTEMPWVIANINASFQYDTTNDRLLPTPISVPQGGTLTLSLENAPTAAFFAPQTIQSMTIYMGAKKAGQPPHYLILYDCQKQSQGIASVPAGEGAWTVQGPITYAFSRFDTNRSSYPIDNTGRKWYF